jgi:molybdenum cofactor guanylyltransferase
MSGGRPARVLGAVLAGGSSRRLGRDKSAERVGGARLIDRAAHALRPHCAEVVVVSARSGTPAGPWRVVPDRRPGAGPLAGLEAALLDAAEEGYDAIMALACDLPLVDSEIVGTVIEGLGDAAAAAAARGGDPAFEPLCAVYRASIGSVASELLDRGERSARALYEAVAGRAVAVPREPLLNVNSEADLVRARAMAEDRGDDGCSAGGEPV